MKKHKLPKGWTEEQIRALAESHDTMTEDEQAAEIDQALANERTTLLEVPTALVPEIDKLIAKKRSA
jgi:hypothetical protein